MLSNNGVDPGECIGEGWNGGEWGSCVMFVVLLLGSFIIGLMDWAGKLIERNKFSIEKFLVRQEWGPSVFVINLETGNSGDFEKISAF